jgi:hypothetical protein
LCGLMKRYSHVMRMSHLLHKWISCLIFEEDGLTTTI